MDVPGIRNGRRKLAAGAAAFAVMSGAFFAVSPEASAFTCKTNVSNLYSGAIQVGNHNYYTHKPIKVPVSIICKDVNVRITSRSDREIPVWVVTRIVNQNGTIPANSQYRETKITSLNKDTVTFKNVPENRWIRVEFPITGYRFKVGV